MITSVFLYCLVISALTFVFSPQNTNELDALEDFRCRHDQKKRARRTTRERRSDDDGGVQAIYRGGSYMREVGRDDPLLFEEADKVRQLECQRVDALPTMAEIVQKRRTQSREFDSAFCSSFGKS